MKLKIQTLAPFHIGTGRDLMPNSDFVAFSNSVAVLDTWKVASVFAGGGQPQPADIDRWVNLIERGEPLLPYLKTRRPDLRAADIGREIDLAEPDGFEKVKAIREQMHGLDGSGLLPGSSLKGAIRTALFAYFLDNEEGRSAKSSFNLLNKRNQFEATQLEKKFFGPSPTSDFMRLVQVGDATFSKTKILKTEVLNLKSDHWQRDGRLETWVEAIPKGEPAEARLNILENARQRHFLKGQRDDRFFEFLKPEQLFKIINAHTLRLIESEIKFWVEDESLPASLGEYADALREIKTEIEKCGPTACVLRCGWASGWRFITGGWQRHLTDETFDKLVLALRPRHPVDLPYPKTTRFQPSGEPMGFLKMEKTD